MKKSIHILLLFFSAMLMAQLQPMSLGDALEAQKKNPKKILINFYTEQCKPCRTMELETFSNPIIAEYLAKDYYFVKFKADGNEVIDFHNKTFENTSYTTNNQTDNFHNFTKFMNVITIPSIVFLDEKNNPITTIQGSLTAKELEPYLPFFANDDYKKIESRKGWETHQRTFKSRIR